MGLSNVQKMTPLFWIIITGFLMSALAAGSLLGGAFFHLLPEALRVIQNRKTVFLSFAVGFTILLLVEQILIWHFKHSSRQSKRPMGYLIIIADGIHNFIGGIGIGVVILNDLKLGITAWAAALLVNFISASGLIPEIKQYSNLKHVLMNFAVFSLGLEILFFTS